MSGAGTGEVPTGLWRFEALHPQWTEEEGGEEGWEPLVCWWALSTTRGLLLIDPLVDDWDALDVLAADHGGCAGIVRTVHWHQRTIAEAAGRYGAETWASPTAEGGQAPLPDHPLQDGDQLWDGITAVSTERDDELALWLPSARALLFGDAMLRRGAGRLTVCPDWWVQPEGGVERLHSVIRGLTRFPAEHVLVSHGPLVLDDGLASLRAAVPERAPSDPNA